ncbi:PIG-X [Russula emetica]|nr:PIG-X [Russula emetica]
MDISPDDASVILSSTLNPTKGFHTTSTTRFALRGSRAHARSCTLHLYLTLPAQLFADPNELAHRHASYTFERFGGGNLEAPVFAPAASGPSALLLDVNIPEGVVDNVDQDEGGDGNEFSIEVPLHARYGVPKKGGELIDEVMLPPPVAFWTCPQEKESGSSGAKQTQVPSVLQVALKDETSTLVLIPHAGSMRGQTLRVPVGDSGDVAVVETVTVVVILLAFVYLLRTIVRASRAQRVAVDHEIPATKKDN